MTTGTLEHVNMTVTDPQRSAELVCDLFGWQIRWQGPSQMGGHSIHVGNPGNGADYLVFYTNDEVEAADPKFRKGTPLNHVGVTVDDLDAVEAKVKAAGLEPFGHEEYEPGKRFYFFDWNGIEFEVVNYG
ncbi:MAG: VOC family protein [Pseudomonadota bacterium]